MTLGETSSEERGCTWRLSVTFDRVSKVYDNGFRAVDDLDLQIRDGEFMVLVGAVRLRQDDGAPDARGAGGGLRTESS